MSTKLEFDYENEHYVLEYNREAIKLMEKSGFVLDEYTAKPMTMVEMAFQFAFYKNHPKTKLETIDKIFNGMKNKQALNNQLLIMIDEAYSVLWDEKSESSEDDGKNIEWKIV